MPRAFTKRSTAGILAILLLAMSATAATLDNYRQRVEAIHMHVDTLLDSVARSELGARQVGREQAEIAKIKLELPATEKVEWAGRSVDVSNEWLFSELDRFSAEADAKKRAIILTSVNERLNAVAKEVDDLQKATYSGPTKDQDKQKLADILNRPEFQKAQPQDESLFQKWMREFQEWLDSVFPKSPNLPQTASGLGGLKMWLQILIYAAVLALVGFVIYKFAPLVSRRFGLRQKSAKTDRVILGEKVGADESGSDLFAEAERMARDGDLRGAIRKGYIALLCELSDRKIIGLARHKTNRDYLRDLRRRTAIIDGVSGMTLSFERNWYGIRPSETQDWEDFRSAYRQTISNVK